MVMLHQKSIPLGGMTRDIGRLIGSKTGMVEDVDTDEDGVGWGPYLRVKVGVDITKPFMHGMLINVLGSKCWISFKYERLSNLCFNCGTIKHSASGCDQSNVGKSLHSGSQIQYGVWLRALSQKPVSKSSPMNNGSKDHGNFRGSWDQDEDEAGKGNNVKDGKISNSTGKEANLVEEIRALVVNDLKWREEINQRS